MIDVNQKQKGIYYTPGALSSTITRWTLDSFLIQFLHDLNKIIARLQTAGISLQNKLLIQLRIRLNHLISLKICDPALGGGIFLATTFLYLSDMHKKIVKELNLLPNMLKNEVFSEIDFFKDDGQEDKYKWQKHVLRSCLYGVDISSSAVNQSVTDLSITSNLNPEEWNVDNLKVGNSLLIPSRFDLHSLENKFQGEIARIIKQRRKIQQATNKLQPIHLAELKKHKEKVLQVQNIGFLNNLPVDREEVRSPFDWPIEFPEVFFDEQGRVLKNPGFDIILTNPPWEAWKPIDNEFFSQFDPNFKKIKIKTQQLKLKQNLLLNPTIRKQFEKKNQLYKHLGHFFRSTYHNQGRGDLNLYKLFFELCWNLTKPRNGRVGILIPSGILGDLGTKNLRKLLFNQSKIYRIAEIITGKDFFPDIHRELGLVIIIYQKGSSTNEFSYISGINSLKKLNTRKTIKISRKYVMDYAPESFTVPIIHSPEELTILEKLYRFPPFGHNCWGLRFGTELHRTNHANYFSEEKTDIPVLEGKHITRFGYTLDNIQFYVQRKDIKEKFPSFTQSRLVWRSVSDRFLRRRMFVSVVDSGIALANSLNYIAPVNEEKQLEKLYYLAGVMNSLVFEYRVRQLSFNQNLNHYLIKSIPVPLYEPKNQLYREIMKKVVSIIPKANDWARNLNLEGKKAGKEIEEQLFPNLASIDISVTQLYELTSTEFNLILETFPKLSKGYIDYLRSYLP
ncbi:MAG: Eco57I restriction-modification methylase domain-containing protein [Candidatus Hermodarchaeota archaeon]